MSAKQAAQPRDELFEIIRCDHDTAHHQLCVLQFGGRLFHTGEQDVAQGFFPRQNALVMFALGASAKEKAEQHHADKDNEFNECVHINWLN